jgi:predicted TIM-barrel fold metal-dependent hydrolase
MPGRLRRSPISTADHVILDCHVHTAALLPGHGRVSEQARRSVAFRILRRQLGLGADADDAATERALERTLVDTLAGAPEVDAAVVLAFDRVYTRDGRPDDAATHFYVANEFVASLAATHPKIRFGASIHPYRSDAAQEIERCVKAGAVLCKWLPITHRFDPADAQCVPAYEALAHFGLPLLSHTGWEHVLPKLDRTVAAPARLVPALERGVTVIAAHCGTGRVPGEGTYLSEFMRLAHEHERLYGDTAALSLPDRWGAYDALLGDDVVRAKLVHGSDWPVPAYPRPWRHGWRAARALVAERNQLRRDVLIKQALGFDDAYWGRAAQVLRCATTNTSTTDRTSRTS